jgi:hypothetical protein
VHEYALDEENKIAQHVWSYVPDPPVFGWHCGNAQRLPNGNTFIGWGGDGSDAGPACTEITPDGQKAFELFFDDPGVESYRAFRLPLPEEICGPTVTRSFVGIGDHKFTYGQIDTGVTIRINCFTGTGYNAMGVQRLPLAPLYPTFTGRAPIVLPVRVQVGASGIITIDGRISLHAGSFGLQDPEKWTIYHRKAQTTDPFAPLSTSYDPATDQVRADMREFGEFILGRPDLEHVALAPILIAPEPNGTVNETLSVALDWTPRGFVDSYHLQVAADAEFSTLLVDEPEVIETPYVWENAGAGTTYYWRVSTTNDAGPSAWSQASFTTVPPMVRVTAPNGGEQWQRGIEYFIQWDDNLDEDVTIDLYQGDVLLRSISTEPSTGACKWEVDTDLEPGNNYSIKIRSSTDETLSDMSDTAFTIIE